MKGHHHAWEGPAEPWAEDLLGAAILHKRDLVDLEVTSRPHCDEDPDLPTLDRTDALNLLATIMALREEVALAKEALREAAAMRDAEVTMDGEPPWAANFLRATKRHD